MREQAEELLKAKTEKYKQLQAKYQDLQNTRNTLSQAMEKLLEELISVGGELRVLTQLLNDPAKEASKSE